MKLLKKLLAVILSVVTITSCLSVFALADTGSYASTDYAKNKLIKTTTYVDWSNNGTSDLFWGAFNEKITGEASTYWYGSKPYNADTIILTNEVSCEKIMGSFSVSGGPQVSTESVGASVSAGVSVSSDTTSKSYSYSVSNKWNLNVDFSYNARVSGLWLIADIYFETSATTQLGSSFYVTNTGYHHISK